MEVPVELLLETSKRSFKFFMHAILGWTNPDFLNNLDDALADQSFKHMVAAYPRGHGKSTHLSIGYPLWLLAQDHNLRILIVSDSNDSAKKMLRGIMNHIEENPKYQEFAKYCDPNGIGIKPKMGTFAQRKMEENWSSGSITIERDAVNLKDPTVRAIGLYGSIVGRRADVIIADDIVNQKNSETEESRQKVKDWFYTTILPILVKENPLWKVMYLGNTWNMNDLVSNLLADPQFEYRERLKSIIQEADRQDLWQQWASIRLDMDMEPKERLIKSTNFYNSNKVDMDKGVKVLWPDVYSYSDLYLERLANSYAFARMRQCDPSLRPDAKFQEVWLTRAKEKGKDLRLQDVERKGFTMDITTAGVDLAISLKDSADDTVLLIVDRVKYGNEVIKTGDYVIRNIKRGKFTPNEVRLMIKNCNDFVKPLGIRVESVAYQESIVRDLWDMGQVNVRGHKTGGEKNDMEIGINSLAILLENGKLVIPYNLQDARTVMLSSKLIDEMRSYPDGHTGDSLMALWFSYLEIRDLTGKRIVFPGMSSLPTTINTPEGMAKEEFKADLDIINQTDHDRMRGISTGKKFII